MRKYQKMGCVRYAANDAKAAELERMGYAECTCYNESGNTEEQEKSDSKPGTRRKSGKKGKADPETDSEAPAEDPALGGDDDGSDPTDNK